MWGLGARAAAAAAEAGRQPQAKRQKRGDILDSLGLGGGPAEASKGLLGGLFGKKPSPAASLPTGTAATAQSKAAADKEALRQWLEAEEAKPKEKEPTPPEADAPKDEEMDSAGAAAEEPANTAEAAQGSAEEGSAEDPQPQSEESSPSGPPRKVPKRRIVTPGKVERGWKKDFEEAQDKWHMDSSSGGLRLTYFLSSRGLYFDWDQQQGVLFQYFFEGSRAVTKKAVAGGQEAEQDEEEELPERHPIWAASCPDMHSEVWEVLPLPPTDPASRRAAKAKETGVPSGSGNGSPSSAAEVAAEGSSDSPTSADSAASMLPPAVPRKPRAVDSSTSASGPASAAMLPPPLPKKKKLPPVPVMAPPSAHSKPAEVDVADLLDGDDSAPAPAPTPASGSAAPAPRRSALFDSMEDGEEGPGNRGWVPGASSKLSQQEEADDETRPSMFDSDDEDAGPLASEESALPSAPAEKAEPTATDLDLDMFAGM